MTVLEEFEDRVLHDMFVFDWVRSTIARLEKERDALKLCEESCVEFVRKCECGEARSVRSYSQMKKALKTLTDTRAELTKKGG